MGSSRDLARLLQQQGVQLAQQQVRGNQSHGFWVLSRYALQWKTIVEVTNRVTWKTFERRVTMSGRLGRLGMFGCLCHMLAVEHLTLQDDLRPQD